MRYISLSFDDGREDNYLYAFPIMRKYGLTGTIFCTTGFIDGSWNKPLDWLSVDKAIQPNQLSVLERNGWELALHGDHHTVALDDCTVSIEKMNSWRLGKGIFGFSIPNSGMATDEVKHLLSPYLGQTISYIRTGRKINTRSIEARALFGLYTYGGLQWAYNQFNKHNVNYLNSCETMCIYSVVIRNADKPEMILRFLRDLPENAWVVFMLHSILPENNHLYGKDAWCWSESRFEHLCHGIRSLADGSILEVANMNTICNKIERKAQNED